MLDVSAAYTAAIKDKNRTDRITGAIKLCDGETINITDDIIVNNSVTLKEQLVSGDTFEIGTFYTNQLDITVYDNNFLSRTYANARITPKYEIQLADGTWESVPLGIFTVDNSLTKRKGSIHKLTAFDDSTKFDVDISVYSGGKKTVQQHIKDLAADVGITLVTTDFSSYPNYDLTVDSTVSSSVQTYRDLIEWCCALMASSARINRYGKLEIVKLKEKKKIVDGALVYDADYTVEGYERTGTEFFDLRALTKYFSTAFDGEPYVYKNHAVLTLPDAAARNATMFIPENPLLQSVSDAERKTAFETCVNTIYIALRRVEFSFNGNPAIECFDTLFGNGGKIDINGTIAFFPTLLVWKYRGAHKVSCAFAELTDEATESASEAAISVVNASTINKMPVQVKSKTEKRLDGVGKTAFDASSVGKFTATGIGCEIFNDYENNIASSTYAHAEGSGTKATAPSTHAEGSGTAASNTYAHAEGNSTTASGISSHAEGENTTASGYCSHAEGYNAVADGGYSHAEGYNALASGWYSHAGGINSKAKAEASFAHGMYAVSDYRGGAAFGIMNKTKDALFVVGNGSPRGSYESDALVLDDGGNLWVAGSIKCGGGSGGYTLPPATADTLGGVMIGDNISVTADGVISVNLSAYLKNTDIADWAKAESKPVYTAKEVGAAEKNHTHNMSDITDMPEWTKTENKPAYTASEFGLGNVDNTADIDKPISTATQTALDGKSDTGHTHTVSDITDMPAYLTQETDPTVPAWAKAKNKPTYTADEVGAAKKNHTHNMSDITDMPEWTKTENKPVYTASEVGAATAADITAAVNAVEIGGRNLLYDSTGNLKKGWSGNTIITVDGGISGNSLAISRTGYSGNARYFGTSKRHFLTDFNVGTSYTLSAWIKVRSDAELDASGYVMARFRSADNTKLHILPLTVNNKSKKDEWLYCEKTWTIDDSDIAKLECVALALDKNGMIEACNIKLEKGTKATDWSPAVEEDTERIASLEARVAALEAMAVSGGEV